MNKMPPLTFLERHDPRAENMQELLEIAKKVTTDLFEADGEIKPTFLFDNPPGNFTSAMQFPWRNDNEKHAVAHCVRSMLSTLGLNRYAVICEMFFSVVRVRAGDSMSDAYKNAPRPSENPNRSEGILISVHDVTGEKSLSACYVIERPANAKPRITLDERFNSGSFIDMTFAPVPHVKN